MAKAKSAPKVMDVVHPSVGRRPSPTSRPVILPDRAYLAADPMLSTADTAEDTPASSAPENKDVAELSGAPALHTPTQEVVQTEQQPAELRLEPLEQGKSDTASQTDKDGGEQLETTPVATVAEAVSNPLETVPAQADTTESAPVNPAPVEVPSTEENEQAEDETPATGDETGISGTPLQAQSPQTPDEAALKAREEELERLIAAGTYAAPINTVKRRRARLVLLVSLVLILVVVAIDLLADIGIITLPFGLPHTTFLGH